MIKYKEGDVYNTKIREDAVQEMGELYQNFGHLYAQIRPIESLDPKNKRVNVTYNVYEGDQLVSVIPTFVRGTPAKETVEPSE